MADAINALPVLDTSDRTATANDLAEGTVAYVNGEQVVGALEVKDSISVPDATPNYTGPFDITVTTPSGSHTVTNPATIILNASIDERYIKDADSNVQLSTRASNFGDATAADVAAGKTFTSSAGLKVTGTSSNFIKVTGTTTSETIDTGLSSIEFFEIHRTSLTSAGFVQGAYSTSSDTLNFTYCSSYSSSSNTCSVASATATFVDGGVISLALSFTSSNWGLSSGVTYYWTAFGQA